MTSGPQSSPRSSLVLPLALIGPRAQGRSYGVLATSSGFTPPESVAAALTDVALVLSAWAERGAGGFSMLVPLERSGLSLLMRARYVGRAELGQVAMGVAAFLDRVAAEALGHRVHRLLARLPDELPREGFGPLVVDPQSLQAPPQRLPDIGLGWEDAIVDARGQDPEAVLCALLDAIEPDEQRARLAGWASSGGLTRKGRFAPSEAFNLVVHAPDEAVRPGDAPAGRRRVSLDALPQPQPPPAWEAWSRLKALQALPTAAWAQVAGLRWSPDNARLKPADVVAVAVVQACIALSVADRAALLVRIAREPSQAFEAAFELAVETLAKAAGSPAQLAALLAAFLAQADREALKRLSPMLDLFAAWEVLARLGPAEIATLLQIGLVRTLARRAGAPPQGSPLLEPLLADACKRAGSSAQVRAFAVTLVRAAAASRGASAVAQAALPALLALPAATEDRRLATPGIAAAAGEQALQRALSARSVRPVLRAPRDGRELRDALAAALRLERALEAVA